MLPSSALNALPRVAFIALSDGEKAQTTITLGRTISVATIYGRSTSVCLAACKSDTKRRISRNTLLRPVFSQSEKDDSLMVLDDGIEFQYRIEWEGDQASPTPNWKAAP